MKEENIAEETVDKIKKYRSVIFSCGIFAIVLLIVGILTLNINKQINLKEKEVYVQTGENYSIEYTLNGLNKDQLVWESKDNNVATVNSGNIIGIAPGETLITVSSGEEIKEAVRVYVLADGMKRAAIIKDVVPGKKYTCDDDWVLSGNKCSLYTIKDGVSCTEGFKETTNDRCVKEADATIEYSCPKGYYLYSKEKCISNE